MGVNSAVGTSVLGETEHIINSTFNRVPVSNSYQSFSFNGGKSHTANSRSSSIPREGHTGNFLAAIISKQQRTRHLTATVSCWQLE